MTMTLDLEALTAQRQAAREAAEELDRQWLAAIKAEIDRGVTKVAVARRARISRGRLYQILGQQP